MTSGMVTTLEIGQSAAKLLRAAMPMEKVQRLSGSGLGPCPGLRYSLALPRGSPGMKGLTSPEPWEPVKSLNGWEQPSQMPRHLISDAHEWINEIPTVPIYYLAKPQPRERAWNKQRGKKTLLSLTLVRLCEMT